MITINLLSININALFEQYSVAEIDYIQKQLDLEVEKKREELRTMVGESYRELLKAADTIAVMKDTSEAMVEQVGSLVSNVKKINEKQLIGFQTNIQQMTESENADLDKFYCTAVQVKLLTTMPELIWTNLDAGKYSTATELFIFARHISTGLQLDSNNNFLQYFPVAQKEWETLKPFSSTIRQKCFSVLEEETLSPEIAANCLLSVYILENSSLDKLFNIFVELRTKAFLFALSIEHNSNRRVKDRILSSLEILNSTVELIYKCFFDSSDGEGLILRQSMKFTDDSKLPTLSLTSMQEEDLTRFLPSIITKFKPSFEVPTLSLEAVQIITGNWLSTISTAANTQLKNLFELVSSMKNVREIVRASQSINQHSKWTEMCEHLHLPPALDFYQHQYQPLLNERIRDIIRNLWSNCTETLYKDCQKLFKSSSREPDYEKFDLWLDDQFDVPPNVKNFLNQDKKGENLLMKIKGFTPDIIQVCANFDKNLETLFSEVNIYVNDDCGDVEEKKYLIEFLQEISIEQTFEIVSQIKSIKFKIRCRELVLLARLLMSFNTLCPNLKYCLSHTYLGHGGENISANKNCIKKWNTVQNMLKNETFNVWVQFCDVLLNAMPAKKFLGTSVGLDSILKDFVKWETILIEEKDEHDNSIQSAIQIPSQPRLSLQKYLLNIIENLNKLVPQTLSQNVLLSLNMKLIDDVLNCYNALVLDKLVAANQNIALQLFFDLKFLQLFFVARHEKSILQEFQQVTNKLKSFVDPFDFELFYTHMMANVKKSAQRTHQQLGVLLPYPENLETLLDMKLSGGALNIDPNVLSLSSSGSSSTWFPLLPIIETENKGNTFIKENDQMDLAKNKKVELKISTAQSTQNYASNVKSGAAAFFGAMSQDWFK